MPVPASGPSSGQSVDMKFKPIDLFALRAMLVRRDATKHVNAITFFDLRKFDGTIKPTKYFGSHVENNAFAQTSFIASRSLSPQKKVVKIKTANV